MSKKNFTIILFVICLSTTSNFMFGQAEAVSKTSSISFRKPVVSEIKVIDTIAPLISIISPRLDSTSTAYLTSSKVFLIGRLTDDSGIQSLIINDSLIPTDDNGFFQESYNLKNGLNVFEITSSDGIANSSTSLLYLIKEEADETIPLVDEIDNVGEFYGLLIGINNYSEDGLVDLDFPITDATLLYSTLIGNYMFDPENITLLKDPGRAEIIKNLDILSNTLRPDDNLIIFYAGHGHWDEQKETGYWLPSDAEQFSSVNWIRNSTIKDFVDDIDTRHTLLVTDACFAGSIFKTRGAFQDASIAVNKLYSLSSRKAMTSGTLKEVPDKSVFIEYFMKRLQDNEKKYISSGELFGSFREAVLNNSPNIPQYGVIQGAGDEGGEFIFIKR